MLLPPHHSPNRRLTCQMSMHGAVKTGLIFAKAINAFKLSLSQFKLSAEEKVNNNNPERWPNHFDICQSSGYTLKHQVEPICIRMSLFTADGSASLSVSCAVYRLSQVAPTELAARGSDSSGTAIVLAREKLRRFKRGTTTSCQKVGLLPLCPHTAAVSAWCDTSLRSMLTRC